MRVVEDGEEAGDRGTSSDRSRKVSASSRNWNWQAETISVSPGPHYFVLTFKNYQKGKNESQWRFPTLIYNQCSKWMSIITFLSTEKYISLSLVFSSGTNIALHFIFQALEKLVANWWLKPQLGKPRWNSSCNRSPSFETFQTLCYPRRPRGSQSGPEKTRDKGFQACVEGSWVPTLIGSFPNRQAHFSAIFVRLTRENA